LSIGYCFAIGEVWAKHGLVVIYPVEGAVNMEDLVKKVHVLGVDNLKVVI
jgi:hypothetical protein